MLSLPNHILKYLMLQDTQRVFAHSFIHSFIHYSFIIHSFIHSFIHGQLHQLKHCNLSLSASRNTKRGPVGMR